jgi:TRAP-type C4-dicarboxylate transport system substrate-binding protein
MQNDPRYNDPVFKGLPPENIAKILKVEDEIAENERKWTAANSRATDDRIEGAAKHMHDTMDTADRSELDWQLSRFADTGV